MRGREGEHPPFSPAVREAVAFALGKIGAPAVEPLRQILDGDDPELQVCVARAVGDASLAPLTESLTRLGVNERNPQVRAELARALGRIGTPDAVAALVRWATPPRWQFWRRQTGLRLAAVEGLRLAALALVIGTAGAVVAGRFVAPLLFETSPRDPLILGAVAAVMLGTSVLAGALPALRAARVDPNLALRDE